MGYCAASIRFRADHYDAKRGTARLAASEQHTTRDTPARDRPHSALDQPHRAPTPAAVARLKDGRNVNSSYAVPRPDRSPHSPLRGSVGSIDSYDRA